MYAVLLFSGDRPQDSELAKVQEPHGEGFAKGSHPGRLQRLPRPGPGPHPVGLVRRTKVRNLRTRSRRPPPRQRQLRGQPGRRQGWMSRGDQLRTSHHHHGQADRTGPVGAEAGARVQGDAEQGRWHQGNRHHGPTQGVRSEQRPGRAGQGAVLATL
uniref:(northern house mosquito) hypothetical protein n=1 Tax=Culex pipiens TaxID=7175 RepID=A0A8D8IF33_CULPI